MYRQGWVYVYLPTLFILRLLFTVRNPHRLFPMALLFYDYTRKPSERNTKRFLYFVSFAPKCANRRESVTVICQRYNNNTVQVHTIICYFRFFHSKTVLRFSCIRVGGAGTKGWNINFSPSHTIYYYCCFSNKTRTVKSTFGDRQAYNFCPIRVLTIIYNFHRDCYFHRKMSGSKISIVSGEGEELFLKNIFIAYCVFIRGGVFRKCGRTL